MSLPAASTPSHTITPNLTHHRGDAVIRKTRCDGPTNATYCSVRELREEPMRTATGIGWDVAAAGNPCQLAAVLPIHGRWTGRPRGTGRGREAAPLLPTSTSSYPPILGINASCMCEGTPWHRNRMHSSRCRMPQANRQHMTRYVTGCMCA